MATIILGQHADALTVRLTEGDGADLVATLVDSTGAEVDWNAAPTLSFAHSVTRDVIAEHVASIAGPVATWDLSRADVTEIATGSEPRRAGQLVTHARITTPDTGDADGHVEYAGKVDWRDGWSAGDRSQRVTFTLPGVPGPAGPPGSGGGTDVLTIIDGGAVTLDDTKAEGTLVGYRVKATATFQGEGGASDLEPGAYTFERTDSGWVYYVATGTVFGGPPAPAWASLATEDFPQANGTALAAITTDGFAWESSDATQATVQSNKASFVGHVEQNRSLLAVNQTGFSSLRITADYNVSGNGDLLGGLILTSEVNGNPYYDALEASMSGDGTLRLGTYQGAVATVSAQPLSGTMQFEMTGAEAIVRINGTQVLTGTMPRQPNGRAAGLHFSGFGTFPVTFDNVSVERLD